MGRQDGSRDSDDRLTVPELIERATRRDNLTLGGISRRAQDRGFNLSKARLSQLLNTPILAYGSGDVMEALAAGLNETYDVVVAAYSRSLDRPRVWHPDADGPTVIVDRDITPDQAREYGRAVRKAIRKK